jgi:hypothetical protein
MICLRCGYCCKNYCVVIVDDPSKGLSEGNLTFHEGKGPCKFLGGDSPGNYFCEIHNESWYKDTPCFAHTQVELDNSEPCRIGEYVLKNIKNSSK